MRWLNLEVSYQRSPEYAGSEPVNRATWLNLLLHCCEQENSGFIENCGDWKCRQWQQTCGVTLDEVKAESLLWSWEGNSVQVKFYPLEQQHQIQAKRVAGSVGGKRSAANRRKKNEIEATLQAPVVADLEPDLEPDLQRKGREGKEKVKVKEGKKPSEEEVSFLKELWSTCPKTGRERSSQRKVRTAWMSLSPKPNMPDVMQSLGSWLTSTAWTDGEGQYVPGLDRWLRDRKFDILPQQKKVSASGKKRLGEYEEETDYTQLAL